MVLDAADRIRVQVQLSQVFTPAAPVTDRDLFAGRLQQISRVLSAVSQPGQHIVLFGERGVGKTSLASLISNFWVTDAKNSAWLISPRVNCDTTDNFQSIWRKVAEEVQLIYDKNRWSDELKSGPFVNALDALLQGDANPHLVRRFLELSGKDCVIVIDEFDRVDDEEARRLMSDTIKTLSDQLVLATLVLVGVADTVDQLIEEHASIDRACPGSNAKDVPRGT
jgi:Cdc6-like AAA superfamily ATPase